MNPHTKTLLLFTLAAFGNAAGCDDDAASSAATESSGSACGTVAVGGASSASSTASAGGETGGAGGAGSSGGSGGSGGCLRITPAAHLTPEACIGADQMGAYPCLADPSQAIIPD